MSPSRILCSWFGAGFLPKAPGTWGSLAAVPLAWLLQMAGGWQALAVATVLVFAAGVWAADKVVQADGTEDPAWVVIDEVAGQWLTLLIVPPGWLAYAAGFVLFRLFDIWKPWPVAWADTTLKGGFGIMADDILAGIYAAVILAALKAGGLV